MLILQIWRSEGDNYFFIGKKPSRKHFEKNNNQYLNLVAYHR